MRKEKIKEETVEEQRKMRTVLNFFTLEFNVNKTQSNV